MFPLQIEVLHGFTMFYLTARTSKDPVFIRHHGTMASGGFRDGREPLGGAAADAAGRPKRGAGRDQRHPPTPGTIWNGAQGVHPSLKRWVKLASGKLT